MTSILLTIGSVTLLLSAIFFAYCHGREWSEMSDDERKMGCLVIVIFFLIGLALAVAA